VEANVSLTYIVLGVVWLFPLSEIALAILRRADRRFAQSDDRGSMWTIWIAVGVGLACAYALRSVHFAEIRLPGGLVRALAVALLLAGLVIRWVAIVTLGRHFTVDVAIRPDHALVRRGPYRLVRHPSYTGLLLAFLGLGVFSGSVLGLVGLMAPITWAVWSRIAIEERALHAALGGAYADYCARTKRLIPGVV
jgi:protein-S-isoprenylcysteine O-methyltransferase